ncbi:hypothetical protein EYF80_011104 [Liparis tanakae]|uniref:Uncharacterized protein n=1 Tax=Liparis tanakae TaxID=230148 RepID=A0A4Z2IKY1_9TELE|nr:hypothetical protein EYF80_011104 [Liparis tanakae]
MRLGKLDICGRNCNTKAGGRLRKTDSFRDRETKTEEERHNEGALRQSNWKHIDTSSVRQTFTEAFKMGTQSQYPQEVGAEPQSCRETNVGWHKDNLKDQEAIIRTEWQQADIKRGRKKKKEKKKSHRHETGKGKFCQAPPPPPMQY